MRKVLLETKYSLYTFKRSSHFVRNDNGFRLTLWKGVLAAAPPAPFFLFFNTAVIPNVAERNEESQRFLSVTFI